MQTSTNMFTHGFFPIDPIPTIMNVQPITNDAVIATNLENAENGLGQIELAPNNIPPQPFSYKVALELLVLPPMSGSIVGLLTFCAAGSLHDFGYPLVNSPKSIGLQIGCGVVVTEVAVAAILACKAYLMPNLSCHLSYFPSISIIIPTMVSLTILFSVLGAAMFSEDMNTSLFKQSAILGSISGGVIAGAAVATYHSEYRNQ